MGASLCGCFQSNGSLKISKVTLTDVSIERGLLDMPDDILFEIFRRLPTKNKLIEISRLCSKFRDVAGDTRFWKNVYIKYEGSKNPTNGSFAFEELYSEPWPVKAIDLSGTQIEAPVFSEINQIVKVTELDLTRTVASIATMHAILAKYQCTKLCFGFHKIDDPVFVDRASFVDMIVEHLLHSYLDRDEDIVRDIPIRLAPSLSHCKSLKTLHLNNLSFLKNSTMLNFVRNLPRSLENLFLGLFFPKDSFFKRLAESTPNLREIELCHLMVKFQYLLNFQFLQVLHVSTSFWHPDLYEYFIKFPALKTIHMGCDKNINSPETMIGKLQMALEPHGIIVRPRRRPEPFQYPEDGNFWKVSKAM